jgi:hypothetical protein
VFWMGMNSFSIGRTAAEVADEDLGMLESSDGGAQSHYRWWRLTTSSAIFDVLIKMEIKKMR